MILVPENTISVKTADLAEGSKYYQKKINPVVDKPLGKLYRELIRPLVDIGEFAISVDWLRGYLAEGGSELLRQAHSVVDYGYNSRYRVNGEIINIAEDEFDILPDTRTVVVTVAPATAQMVLGTFRVVCGQDLDVFRLFEMPKGLNWPHQHLERPNDKPGEIGRFTLHPFLDALSMIGDSTYRSQVEYFKLSVLRHLWVTGTNYMQEEGTRLPYFVLAPHAYQFIRAAGIKAEEIAGAVATTTPYAMEIRSKFREYWRPEATPSRQPKVYTADWQLGALQ